MLAHSVPVAGRRIQPQVKTVDERNEAEQATGLLRQLELIDLAGVDGAFVHTFVFPLMPHDDNPATTSTPTAMPRSRRSPVAGSALPTRT